MIGKEGDKEGTIVGSVMEKDRDAEESTKEKGDGENRSVTSKEDRQTRTPLVVESSSTTFPNLQLKEEEETKEEYGRRGDRGPLTAFMVFAASSRDRVLRQNPTGTAVDLGRQLAGEWQRLPEATRKVYYDIARADAQKYYKRLRENRDARVKKRPRVEREETRDLSASAFVLYNEAVRKRFKQLNPRASADEITRLVGVGWRNLPATQKRPFEELAREDEDRVRLSRDSPSASSKKNEQNRCGSITGMATNTNDVRAVPVKSTDEIVSARETTARTPSSTSPVTKTTSADTIAAKTRASIQGRPLSTKMNSTTPLSSTPATSTKTTRQPTPILPAPATTILPSPTRTISSPTSMAVTSTGPTAPHMTTHAFMNPNMPHANLQHIMATMQQRSPQQLMPAIDPVLFMKQMGGMTHSMPMPTSPWTLPLPFPPPHNRSTAGLPHPMMSSNQLRPNDDRKDMASMMSRQAQQQSHAIMGMPNVMSPSSMHMANDAFLRAQAAAMGQTNGQRNGSSGK